MRSAADTQLCRTHTPTARTVNHKTLTSGSPACVASTTHCLHRTRKLDVNGIAAVTCSLLCKHANVCSQPTGDDKPGC